MAGVKTYEGVVENGQICIADSISLPEKTRVYVVVPDAADEAAFRIRSPRLVHASQAVDFAKEIVEPQGDARL